MVLTIGQADVMRSFGLAQNIDMRSELDVPSRVGIPGAPFQWLDRTPAVGRVVDFTATDSQAGDHDAPHTPTPATGHRNTAVSRGAAIHSHVNRPAEPTSVIIDAAPARTTAARRAGAGKKTPAKTAAANRTAAASRVKRSVKGKKSEPIVVEEDDDEDGDDRSVDIDNFVRPKARKRTAVEIAAEKSRDAEEELAMRTGPAPNLSGKKAQVANNLSLGGAGQTAGDSPSDLLVHPLILSELLRSFTVRY